MKSPHLPLAVLAMMSCFLAPSLRADDWKTNDGKVYHDVQVLSAQPDAVTILHHDGGASVPLANLSPDLQKRFHYDPKKAKFAAAQRLKDEMADQQALQNEMAEAAQQKAACADDTASAPAAKSISGAHYSEADLNAHSLDPDPRDPNHHTIDDLARSITSLRPDLSDPTYHTTAPLAYTIKSLGPDSSDPNHHTISEIADAGL